MHNSLLIMPVPCHTGCHPRHPLQSCSSPHQVDVDGAVLRMRVPLIDLRQQVAAVRGQVAAAPAALEAGLKRRTDAAKAREALELLLDTANVLSKVTGASTVVSQISSWSHCTCIPRLSPTLLPLQHV